MKRVTSTADFQSSPVPFACCARVKGGVYLCQQPQPKVF